MIFVPGSQPVGGTTIVPSEVLAAWKPRAQQIFPGETLAALVVPALHGSLLRDRDILWFIDNEAAAAALIRVVSGESDVLTLVQQAHLQFHQLRLRPWFEWIDSESNSADGLSRDGLNDSWTLAQGWLLQDFPYPPLLGPDEFLASLAVPISGANSG